MNRKSVPGVRTNPLGKLPVTTGYRVRGSWACGYHTGVDFACPVGTYVTAVRGGKIVEAGQTSWGWQYGTAVIIQDWMGRRWLYAHLDRVRVHVGQRVRKGDYIGRSGNTGRTTGPHLHLEVRKPPFTYGVSDMNPLACCPRDTVWNTR